MTALKVPETTLTVGLCQKKLYEKFSDAGVSEPEVSSEFIIAHVIGHKTVRIFCFLRATVKI